MSIESMTPNTPDQKDDGVLQNIYSELEEAYGDNQEELARLKNRADQLFSIKGVSPDKIFDRIVEEESSSKEYAGDYSVDNRGVVNPVKDLPE